MGLLKSFALLGLACLLLTVTAAAQRGTFDEREVKAVFMFNFAQFVEWPPAAFDSAESPIVIGVLGEDPFGRLLDEVTQGEVVKGRPLTVARFQRVEDIHDCHILFISPSESAMYEEILTALGSRPTLTVGEGEDFTRRGMIRLLTDRNRVRLEINLGVVKAAGLTINSNLLRAARIVGTTGG